MLEGDEVLDVAQETGYRLCRLTNEDVAKKSDQLVFSVHWDLNPSSRRLYMCLQDGQLKTFDLEVPSSYHFDFGRVVGAPDEAGGNNGVPTQALVHDYQLLFRRFLLPQDTADDNPEHVIDSHWDKFMSIESRPNEFLFLIGISKSIMYTSLPAKEDQPYPNRPLLSSITRSDFSGFVYGTPVLQICSHTARVTALSTSPQGQLLASGDEQGNIRVIMLQLINELTGTSNALFGKSGMTPRTPKTPSRLSFNAASRRAASANTVSTTMSSYPFLPGYDLTKNVHVGPIFSLAWLPTTEHRTNPNTTLFGLITGSADRAVRIWRVLSSTSQGLSVEPMQILDTLSTHVLCLHTLLISPLAAAGPEDSPYHYGTDKAQVDQSSSVLIAAGTSIGTVHVWKLPLSHTKQTLLENTTNTSPMLMDDGRYLLSVLQPSEKPIIHVSSSVLSGSMKSLRHFSGDLVLTASDCAGQVNVYASDHMNMTVTDVTEEGRSEEQDYLLQTIQKRYHSPRNSSPQITGEDEATGTVHGGKREGFVPVKEETYTTPLVACAFSPQPSQSGSSPSRGHGPGNGSGGELMICSMAGQLRLFNDLLSNQQDENDHEQRRRGVPEVNLPLSGVGLGLANQFSMTPLAIEGRSAASPPPPPPPMSQGQNQSSQEKTEEHDDSASLHLDNMSLEPLPLPPPPTTKKAQKEQQKQSKAAAPAPAAAVVKTNQSKEEKKNILRASTGSNNEDGPRPRQQAPPQPLTKAAIAGGKSPGTGRVSINVPSVHHQLQPAADSRLGPFTPQKSAAAGGGGNMFSPQSQRSMTSRLSTGRMSRMASMTPSTSKKLNEEESAYYTQIDEVEEVLLDKANNPSPYINNAMSMPALHSTKIVEQAVADLSAKILTGTIDDEVSSQHTTRSDQLRAAAKATAGATGTARYQALTSGYLLDNSDRELMLEMKNATTNKSNKKAGTTFSSEYVQRKRLYALTEDDRKLFDLIPPDKMLSSVSLHIYHPNMHCAQSNMNSKARMRYNRQYGLHSSCEQAPDHSGIWPQYRIETNAEDTFVMSEEHESRSEQMGLELAEQVREESMRRLLSISFSV